MPGEKIQAQSPYLRIVQGNFVRKAEEGAEGARLRRYELSDGTKGEVWEDVFMSWEGKVIAIDFKETQYGENCIIVLDDAKISLGVDSRYFLDAAAKICNCDINKPISFHPYDFEVDGKRKKGISISQESKKVLSAFWDGEKNCKGFPEVDAEKRDKFGKNYWKMFFAEVAVFLKEELQKIKFPQQLPVIESNDGLISEAEGIELDELFNS